MDNISSLPRHSYPKDRYPWTTEKKTNAKGEVRYDQENQDLEKMKERLEKVVDRFRTELRDLKNELAIYRWGMEYLSGSVAEVSSKVESLEKRTWDRKDPSRSPFSKNFGGKALRTGKK